jgi:Tol biopolymer transport system component
MDRPSRSRRPWQAAAIVGAASLAALVSGYGDTTRGSDAGAALIAFQRDNDPNSQIWTIKPDGSGERRLTLGPFLTMQPAWSPDRKRIAFVRTSAGSTTLYLMNADGHKQRKLLPPQVSGVSNPAWSPDGKRVAFAGEVFPRAGIYSIGTNGRGLKPIRTSRLGAYAGPVAVSFSPDRRTIAFTRVAHRTTPGGRVASFELWLARADGSEARKLKPLGSTLATPATIDLDVTSSWAPDGKRLAVTVLTESGTDISVINRDGSGFQDLTQIAGVDEYPTWSPDGKRIAFASDRDGNYELYVMNPDGSNQTRITNNSVPDLAPDWQPAPK